MNDAKQCFEDVVMLSNDKKTIAKKPTKQKTTRAKNEHR